MCCREEWVAVVVQEGVQRVFSSFVEALRRESMKVADGNYSQRSVSSESIALHFRPIWP
jgi:hypothetical protein